VPLALFLAVAFAFVAHSLPSAAHVSILQNSAESQEPKSAITVADAIRMTKLGDSFYVSGGPSDGRVGQFSPDGKNLVIVLRRGNLEKNTNDYSLLLWNAETLFTSATPEVLLTMSSSSNREGIADIKWSMDNETVTFLGENARENHQLYAFNIRARNLKKLTNHPTSVISYSLGNAGAVAFVAQSPIESLWDEKAYREGVVVSRQSIPDLIVGRKRDQWIGEGELYFQDFDGVRRMNVRGKVDSRPGQSMSFLSPDNRYIVVSAKVPNVEVPDAWKHYRNPSLEFNTRADTQRILPITSYFERYELVDTATGTSQLLLDSPIWPPNGGVVWLPDSQSVVLSEVFLPYENAGADEQEERAQHTFIVEMTVSDGRLTKIGDNRLEAVRWDMGTNRLVCKTVFGGNLESPRRIYLVKTGHKWQQSDGSFEEETQPEIILREGMNDPPKIYASRPGRDQERLLLDLNPQFQAFQFGKVQEVHWQWSKGHTIKGGLYYPPNYIPGRRYPLVIQTHGWTPKRFWIDGLETTAYAAQPLAAKAIMVLQVDDEHLPSQYGETGQRREVEEAVAIYESAVDYLESKGLIERNRVGIIGFSHTCFYVKYALVHSKVRFAAASTTEGEDGGYLQFMTNGNLFVDAYSLYGGRPFGKALPAWIQISPGFNVDKTHTPLRITTLSPQNLLLDWEWFEALTLLCKPVDMVMLEDGDHVLEKPWERIVSQQGNVDWFDFWLNAHEDPDPSKAGQYRRWHELRKLQQEGGEGK
jgi:dipeptidyl aminopeptidase/acylaminoacyl peptidase